MKKISFQLPDKIFGIEKSFLGFFWIPLALVLIFIASLKFIILPKVTEIISLAGQIKNQNSELKILKEKLNYLISIDKNQLNKNADNLNSALLRQKNSYILVNIVKVVADKFGYQIRSFSVTPGELKNVSPKDMKMGVVSKLPVDLVVVGPREKYLDFISGLERNLPILTVDKFDLSTIEGVAQIDLTVSAYYVQESADLTSANFSLSDLTLNKQESSVLQNIGNFQKNLGTGVTQGQQQQNFIKYTRENPFNF